MIDSYQDPRTRLSRRTLMRGTAVTSGPAVGGGGLPGAGTGLRRRRHGPSIGSGVQRMAAEYGCTGPVGGVMGAGSWRGFARFLNKDRWD